MSKFMIEDAQITKASSFQPIVQGNTPEVVNIASTLGKVAEYHDEIEKTNNVLPELVDNGAKNLSSINTITLSATSASIGMLYYFDKPIPAGTYNLSFSGTVSNSTAIRWITTPISETATWSGGFDFNQSNLPYSNTLTLTAPIYGIRLWINSNSSANLTNIMICPKELYNISSTYEPYALPNADLTYKISNTMGYTRGSTGVGRYKFQVGLKPGYTDRIRVPVRITCSTQAPSRTPFVINVTMLLDYTLSKQIVFGNGIAMFYSDYTNEKPLIAYQYTSENSIAVNIILTNISSAWGEAIVEMPGFLSDHIIFLTNSGPDITPVYSGDNKNVIDLYAPAMNLISY